MPARRVGKNQSSPLLHSTIEGAAETKRISTKNEKKKRKEKISEDAKCREVDCHSNNSDSFVLVSSRARREIVAQATLPVLLGNGQMTLRIWKHPLGRDFELGGIGKISLKSS